MRKICIFAGAILLLLSLCSCDPQPVPPTEPPTEPTTTAPVTEPVTQPATKPATNHGVNDQPFGIDLRGMVPQQAYQTLRGFVEHYTLTVTVNKESFTFTAHQLGLTLAEQAFLNWYTAWEQSPCDHLLIYNLDGALETVRQALGTPAQDAGIEYSPKAGCFVLRRHQDGALPDMTMVENAMTAAIQSLSPTAQTHATLTQLDPGITDDDPRLQDALDQANAYLRLSLSYQLARTEEYPVTVKLSKATLAQFVAVDEKLHVSVDTEAVDAYICGLASQYGDRLTTATFPASTGQNISYSTRYYGAVLDQEAMAQDLICCLENKLSGTRTAEYQPVDTPLPYGGNYVEVNLWTQQLWLYRDGKQILSIPIVSGNLSSGARTPSGIFRVYEMKTDCWLVGRTFRDYVNYWIAFDGNIGMHDAMWREDFGQEIYKYNGSHGCVNMPPEHAGQVYRNIGLGTHVVVYGLSSYPDWMDQELTGAQSYTLTTQSAPVALNVQAKYPATEITYRSSDPNVVTVDQRGVVTVVGPGSATVTVHSAAVGVMRQAYLKIQFTVTQAELPTEAQ